MQAPVHEQKQDGPDRRRSGGGGVQTTQEEVAGAPGVDAPAIERMQQTAGNTAVTSLIGSTGDGARKQSSRPQRAPAKTDVGSRARATGKRAVAAVGSQLGR